MAPAPRMLPELTDDNRDFWTGGAEGELRILRCQTCRRWVHPGRGSCPCGGTLRSEATSGRGTIFSFTENWQQFHPDVAPPYVIGIVELEEAPDVRIPTNIVHCDAAELACGMPVEVVFEQHGEVFVPLFQPRAPASR